MSYAFAIFLSVTLPFVIGYLFGYDDIDPNTTEGSLYYVRSDEHED